MPAYRLGRKKQHLTMGWALLVAGTIACVAISLVLYRQNASQPIGSPVITQNAPSSTRPSRQAVAGYAVASGLPKYVAIPSIGISQTRIIQTGLLQNHQIASPNNIYDAGWYSGSANPGQMSAMFMYGHLSSWTAHGVFYELKKLKPGSKIIITRGDNKTFSYQVVSIKTYRYDKVDMRAVLSPIDAHAPGLNVMTCAGKLIEGTSQFDERLVVFTTLTKS